MPGAVQNLIRYASLKAVAEGLLVESIEQSHGGVSVRFHPQTGVPPQRLVAFVRKTPGARLDPSGVLRFPVDRSRPEWLDEVRKRLLALEG